MPGKCWRYYFYCSQGLIDSYARHCYRHRDVKRVVVHRTTSVTCFIRCKCWLIIESSFSANKQWTCCIHVYWVIIWNTTLVGFVLYFSTLMVLKSSIVTHLISSFTGYQLLSLDYIVVVMWFMICAFHQASPIKIFRYICNTSD